MEMSGVADLPDQASDALDVVVDEEVVEQRTQKSGIGPAPDDDLVCGRLVHGSTMRLGQVSTPHLIRHLTRVRRRR